MYCLNAKFDFHSSVSFLKRSRGKTGIIEEDSNSSNFSAKSWLQVVSIGVFLKGWGLEVYRKTQPVPNLWENLKATAPHSTLAIWSLIAKGAESIHRAVGMENVLCYWSQTALQTYLRTIHYCGAFIAPFPKEN